MSPITVFLTLACLAMSAIFSSADADGVVDSQSCVGGLFSFNCVAQWSNASDPYLRGVPEASRANAAARDRKWSKRCHPVVKRDGYGVPRYQYAAPGCEYGIGVD
jgi:hypothetical protein